MRRESVYSSNIVSIWYNPEGQLLEIEFHGGGIYQYIWVPTHVYDSLMSAPSHGIYFAQNIRIKYPMVTE